MENVAFFNPHLRKIIFKICTQKITRNQQKQNEHTIRTKSKQKLEQQQMVPRTYRFRIFRKNVSPILTKIIFVQDDSILFLYFLKHFGNN